MLLKCAPTPYRYVEIVTAEILCHLGCASIIWRCESGRRWGYRWNNLELKMKLGGEVTGIHHAFSTLVYFWNFPHQEAESKNSSSNARFYRGINALFSCITTACTSVCGWFQPALHNCQLFPPRQWALYGQAWIILMLVVFRAHLTNSWHLVLSTDVILGGGGGGWKDQREKTITRAPFTLSTPPIKIKSEGHLSLQLYHWHGTCGLT